jgi:hypothetical protein
MDRKRHSAILPPFIWRNYASELERRLDIQLERIDEKNPTDRRIRFTVTF